MGRVGIHHQKTNDNIDNFGQQVPKTHDNIDILGPGGQGGQGGQGGPGGPIFEPEIVGFSGGKGQKGRRLPSAQPSAAFHAALRSVRASPNTKTTKIKELIERDFEADLDQICNQNL